MDKSRFYERRRERLWRMYWEGNDGSDILRPNGFRSYPKEIYDLFLSLIDHSGSVIDLGCGNGLMLKHLVENSRYKLTPHGVDFIEESIRQAKEIVLPEYAENFKVANIADINLEEESFDFIFLDPYALHPSDIPRVAEMVVKACKPSGKVIFYTYRDVLRVLRLIGLLKLR